MGARKNRPDKCGAEHNNKSNHQLDEQVHAVRDAFGAAGVHLRFEVLDNTKDHRYYQLDSESYVTSPDYFCCLLTYSRQLDRWGATHNMALSDRDKDRLLYQTAREAVVGYRERHKIYAKSEET